jgi:hypothetical protein
MNFPPISALKFITGHNLAYTYKFQLKTTLTLTFWVHNRNDQSTVTSPHFSLSRPMTFHQKNCQIGLKIGKPFLNIG